jgi:hypothetical protein
MLSGNSIKFQIKFEFKLFFKNDNIMTHVMFNTHTRFVWFVSSTAQGSAPTSDGLVFFEPGREGRDPSSVMEMAGVVAPPNLRCRR